MIAIKNFDINLLLAIHNTSQNPIFDVLMPFISSLGNAGLIWISMAVILMLQKKYRRVGIMCLIALLLGTITGEVILKHAIGRARPFMTLPDIKLLIEMPTTYSFPSGHTTSSFAAAAVLSRSFKRYRIPLFALAGLIAFSRMYLLVHYPSDIFAGIILGLICARIAMEIGKKYLKTYNA